jgi:membrane protease subunit (stomatin/prohibitin family)
MMRRGPGLIGMAARTAVVAGTATAVSGRVARRQQAKYASQDAAYVQRQASAAEAGYAQQAAAPPTAEDPATQIQKLAQLHETGALSDEEFAAAKAKILGI